MKNAVILTLLAGFWVAGMAVGADWQTVATLQAGGGAKEVAVNQQVSEVMFTCTDGSVIVNTFVVRDGGKKTPHRAGARIDKGNSLQFSVGNKVNCSGLRISDDGSGHYAVKVR